MEEPKPAYDSSAEKNVGVDSPTDSGSTHVAVHPREPNRFTRWGINAESFQRRVEIDGVTHLNQSMKPRHLHMIAIGGSIGAGFFVGSGSALNNGGPGALLIDFLIMGVMIFNGMLYRLNTSLYANTTRSRVCSR